MRFICHIQLKQNALETQDKYPEALESFQKALDLSAAQAALRPDSLNWQRGLATSHSHVARLQVALGRFPEARANYENDQGIMRRLVDDNPDNNSLRHDLTNLRGQMVRLLKKKGRPKAALALAVVVTGRGLDPNYDWNALNVKIERRMAE